MFPTASGPPRTGRISRGLPYFGGVRPHPTARSHSGRLPLQAGQPRRSQLKPPPCKSRINNFHCCMCAFAAPTGRQASCGNQSDRLVGLGPLRGGSIERLHWHKTDLLGRARHVSYWGSSGRSRRPSRRPTLSNMQVLIGAGAAFVASATVFPLVRRIVRSEARRHCVSVRCDPVFRTAGPIPTLATASGFLLGTNAALSTARHGEA